MDDKPPPLKVRSYKEALQSLKNAQQLLESRGHMQEALSIGSTVDAVTFLLRDRAHSKTFLKL